ncbi:hypothetical protein BDY19DRAFT_962838 [Irpex rosettiformis]|uniref:Uncharacterized protein n=1 Tax=Irpex rosettiformis TaxID=378272 RepID=A0ACB8TVH8_9APHY|nr:hypothetical protein BDY19DRAFT_962838 [Irpex rosettiformis]
MTDPVAAKSSFLCMYMSNHPDTLVSYVRHWGKVQQKVTSAQMTAIDTKGMSLTYTTSKGKQEIRVPFNPPLAGYEEVKPRLLGMKVDAEEALGMAKASQISDFQWDSSFKNIAYIFAPFALLTFLPGPTSLLGPSSPTYEIVEYVRENWIGPRGVIYFWSICFSIHALESLYTFHLCRKSKTPFGATFLYVVSTWVCGFNVWVHFRKRIQAARIDSIMKGQ